MPHPSVQKDLRSGDENMLHRFIVNQNAIKATFKRFYRNQLGFVFL